MPIPELLGLINRYLKGTISKVEMDLLEELLKKEENAEIFKEMVKDDYLLKSANREFDTDSAYQKVLSNIESVPKENKRFLRPYYKWAAVLILPVLLFAINQINRGNELDVKDENAVRIIFDDGKSQSLDLNGPGNLFNTKEKYLGKVDNGIVSYEETNPTDETNTLVVPRGKHFQIRLSDGTEVFMNAGSSLSYPVSFVGKDTRSVALKGEAFFKVSKDKSKPFKVKTGELEIEVLGTEFNVSAYLENTNVYTTLQEGSVKVNASNRTFLLRPQDQTIWNRESGTMVKRVVDVSRFMAWMNDEIVFTSASFNDILKELERQHDVEIINELPEIGNELFTARFNKESVEQIMNYFSESYGFEYRKEGNKIVIVK